MLKATWKAERLKILKYLDDCNVVVDHTHKIKGAGEYFFVNFQSGIKECWIAGEGVHFDTGKPWKYPYRYNMPIGDCLNSIEIPIYMEHETRDLIRIDSPMFTIQYSDMVKAGFCPTRIKIHELICDLTLEGWRELEYPLDILDKEFQELKESNVEKYQFTPNRLVKIASGAVRGKRLYSHFFPWGKLSDGNRPPLTVSWAHSLFMYRAMRYLVSRKKNINRTNIVDRLQGLPSIRSGPRIPNCNFWRAVLRRFAPSAKTVFDYEPAWGEKALAAACEGLDYGWNWDSYKHSGCMEALCDFVNIDFLDVEPETADVSILSSYTPLDEKSAVDRLSSPWKQAIIIIQREAAEAIEKKMPPSRKLFFAPHQAWVSYKPDYIFHYDTNIQKRRLP